MDHDFDSDDDDLDSDEFDSDDFDSDDDDQLASEWYERKSAMMAEWLGAEHDMVMHAVFPYAMGGSLDLYYYPNGIEGTGIATKELSSLPDAGSSNDVFETFELVMFTRHALSLDDADDPSTPFGRAHQSINAVLNTVAPYSEEATLNPYETCEIPDEMEERDGRCLLFDAYAPAGTAEFGLLLLVELHRSEMEFAREHGGEELISLLKSAGHYPYSDLDRPPVV